MAERMQGLLFPSPEWAEAYCRALNESESYRKAAATWRAGSILFIVRELPEQLKSRYGSDSVGFILDLHEGVCRGARWTTEPDPAMAPFVISARYRDWVDVVTGKVHPVTALMTMKLRVEKGDIGVLLRYAQAAIAMVEAAKNVPSQFVS